MQVKFPFNCLPPSMETKTRVMRLADVTGDRVSIQLFAPINGDSVQTGSVWAKVVTSFHSIVCPHQWRQSLLIDRKTKRRSFHSIVCPHQWRRTGAFTDGIRITVSIQLFAPINGDNKETIVVRPTAVPEFPFNCLPPSMETFNHLH